MRGKLSNNINERDDNNECNKKGPIRVTVDKKGKWGIRQLIVFGVGSKTTKYWEREMRKWMSC